MKNIIIAFVCMILELVFAIAGLTLLIVSCFVDYDIAYVLNNIGCYGVGSAIGSLITTVGFISLAMWYEKK